MPKYLFVCLLFVCLPLTAGGEIAITFDDAPKSGGAFQSGLQRTEMLLAELKQHRIDQVMFFCTTRGLDQDDGAERLKRYAAAGHLLANHTHTHPWLHEIGPEAYIEDVRRAHKLLRKMPGFRPFFRYPFLNQGRSHEVRDQVWAAVSEMGYRHGYVTVDNYDWYLDHLFKKAVAEGRKVDMDAMRDLYIDVLYQCITFYDDMGRKHLGRSPRHVLLLHENDLAALFVGDLADFLRSRGWKIITPEEAYSDPIARNRPHVLMGQGRVAGIARAEGYQGSFVHVTEDEQWLDQAFEEVVMGNKP